MGVILSKPSHSKETMQFPGFLMPVYRSQFEISDREISITSNLRFVDQHMGETIHRFNPIFCILYLCEVHLISIIFEMAGLFPKIEPEKMGADDDLISSFQMLLLFKIF